MKRVTAFVGSARKKHTHNAVQQFMSNLKSLGDVEYEIVALGDCRIETCRGCKACINRGEEFCPFKDDRDMLIEKMQSSDGVVFASPNYSFQVSAIMKIFLDRLGFVFHRPRFFGKTFTNIVVQGIYGGPKIVKYFDFISSGLGFNTVKGICITSMEPMTDKQQKKTDRVLARHSRKFYWRLMKPALSTPTLLKLLVFRMSRTSVKLMLDEGDRDYAYYRDNGWFESDYFYPTRLGVLKKTAGCFFDSFAKSRARKR
jgi:multimeric flavodoxin WrbA